MEGFSVSPVGVSREDFRSDKWSRSVARETGERPGDDGGLSEGARLAFQLQDE